MFIWAIWSTLSPGVPKMQDGAREKISRNQLPILQNVTGYETVSNRTL